MNKMLKIFIAFILTIFVFSTINIDKKSTLNNYNLESKSIVAITDTVDIVIEEIDNYVFNVGDTFQIVAYVTPDSTTNKEITYESSDINKATVSKTGLVTFISPRNDDGYVTIRLYANNGNVMKSIRFRVVIPIKSIQIETLQSPVLPVGEKLELKVSVDPYNATDKTLVYTSSNDCATVSSNGVVTGVKEGMVRITVKTPDGTLEDYVDLYVGYHVESVEITNTETVLCVGETLQLNISFTPENAALKTYTITSSNQNIASVSETGVLSALKVGRATITLITTDKKISAQYSLMIKEAQNTPAEISMENVSITDSTIVIEKAVLNVEYMLKDSSGNIVCDWITKDSNNRITFEDLKSGKTYNILYRLKETDTKAASDTLSKEIKTKKKDFKKLPPWLIIIIAILALGSIGLVLFFVLKKKKKED